MAGVLATLSAGPKAAAKVARSAATKARKGGITKDDGRRLIMDQLDRLEKMKNSGRINASEYDVARAEVYDTYQGVSTNDSVLGTTGPEVRIEEGMLDEGLVNPDNIDDATQGAISGSYTPDYNDPQAMTNRMLADEEMAGLDRAREAARRQELGVGPSPMGRDDFSKVEGLDAGFGNQKIKMRSKDPQAPISSAITPHKMTPHEGLDNPSMGMIAEPQAPMPSSAGMDPTFNAFPENAPNPIDVYSGRGARANVDPQFRELSNSAQPPHRGFEPSPEGQAAPVGTGNAPDQTYYNRDTGNYDKKAMPVAGAAGLGSQLSDDAQDAGLLADPTLMDNNGRVTPITPGVLDEGGAVDRFQDVFSSLPSFALDVGQDLGSQALSGLSGLGTLLGGGSLSEATEAIGNVRGATEVGERAESGIERELVSLFESNPRALELMQMALNAPGNAGESIYQQTGSPLLSALGEGITGTALEVL